MRFPKLLLFACFAVIAGFGIFQISLKTYKDNYFVPGCVSQTSDGQIDPTETAAFWNNQAIPPLLAFSDTLSDKQKQVLGDTADEKWIEVDLSDQKLTAHQGDKIFLQTLISSGLWFKTPVGEYRIWYKTLATKMEGGIKGQSSYYYLPNVPFDMFFFGSYGIHGAYWHNNFGRPMSHGCVNAAIPDAEKLFYWTDPQLPAGKKSVRSSPQNPGTRVVIHD